LSPRADPQDTPTATPTDTLTDTATSTGADFRTRVLDWIDERTGVREIWRSQFSDYQIDEASRSWLTLGGLVLFIFALQIVSGTLLLFHFVPDTSAAFESVRTIKREVPFGWFIQAVHGHGANLMVVAVLCHMLRIAYLGAYKDGRELNWIAGCLLLAMTLGACLTGYILPWNQVSYWATTVVTSAMENVPLIGPDLLLWVRGAPSVGPETFRRAFASHVALIPLSMFALVGLHLYLLRRNGSSPHPARKDAPGGEIQTRPFYPDFVLQDALVFVAYLGLLVALIVWAPNLFSPPASFLPADPFDTPPGVKPEWYFLWGYQLLRMMPEFLALLVQGAAFAGLVALPFLDRSPHRHPRDRPWVMLAIAIAAAILVALTVAGSRS